MIVPKRSEWTVEGWRAEPPARALQDLEEPSLGEQSPPLWKDLAAASIAAVLLWGAAALLFG